MKRLLVMGALLVALIVGSALWWKFSLVPANSSNNTSFSFVVSRGDGVREIARKLKDAGLIRDQIAFFLLVKKLGIEKNIQAGSFKLSPSMSAFEIANKLTVGTEDVWITIPEGWRSEQILAYLGKDGDWHTNEGKYFPETYLIPKDMPLEDIRQLMLKTFTQKINFPVSSDQLIVASLVEREGKSDNDRPQIASVIYNRLKIGMKLDIDATVQYALGSWKKDLTEEDLAVKSLYNTYTNAGLPPSPICNPGLSAIKAAISPAKTDYLYYIHDKSGLAHFAKTIEEHNANVAKYL